MQNLEASNDQIYKQARCRTLPIPETVTFIPHYPTTLKIFKTNASQFWQLRAFINGKAVIRSARTTLKRDAITLAKEFYHKMLTPPGSKLNGDLGFKPVTHKIEFVSALVLQSEQARVDRNEIAEHSHRMLVSRLRKHVVPFFKDTAVEDLRYKDVEEFLNFLSKLGYKSITLLQYLMALRKVMVFAKANRWIEHIPDFPKIKITSIARGNFTVTEYLQLIRCAKTLRQIKNRPLKITHRNTKGGIYAATDSVPFEFSWLIRFMVNSFVRPVDIKIIQHQHVEVIRGKHCYLRLSLPETKSHKSQIITLPAAVHIYEVLRSYFDRLQLAGPTDYLFLPAIKDRLAAMTLMEKHFRNILITTGLRHGTQGQRRTLYSLRHSAITFRLLYGQGIDLLTLARNARTSLEMVDKFYASELRAEMNVAMLHSRR